MEQTPAPIVSEPPAPELPPTPAPQAHDPSAVLACLTRLVQLAEIDYQYRWAKKESSRTARRTATEVKLAVDRFVQGLTGLGVTGLANDVNALTTKYVSTINEITK